MSVAANTLCPAKVSRDIHSPELTLEIEAFFKSVWGASDSGRLDGVHYIAAPRNTGGFDHFPVRSVVEAVNTAAKLDKLGRATYFACAGYYSDEGRKAENASGAWCLWVDLDCGLKKAEKGDGYATKNDAKNDLARFCKAAGLPSPNLITGSGNGLHCYWALTQKLNNAQWRRYASILKRLAKKHGFRADPSRTADIASLLRVPGTYNRKDPNNPKLVSIKLHAELRDSSLIAEALDAADSSVVEMDNPFANAVETSLEPLAENPANIQRIVDMLMAVGPDTDRDTWKVLCWAVLNTGWSCAESLVRDWSESSKIPGKFNAADLDRVIADYDSSRGVTIGTLIHHAALCGYVESESSNVMDELNKRYFVSRIGGGVFVCDETDTNPISGAMTFTAFKQLRAGYPNGEAEAKSWLSSPERRTYDAIVFNPRGDAPVNHYNTWHGFALEPIAGDCRLILQHIEMVLCSGDQEHYTYVINWLALMVQKPWVKPGVAIVLRSIEGTGKSVIAEMMLRICGRHGFVAAHKEQIAGRFNGHLFDKVFISMEEALFAADGQAVSVTKALITNETLAYESKGKDSISASNYAHVWVATNNDWAAPAGADSRRWCMPTVSSVRKGDAAYFKALWTQIEGGGTAAFLSYLMAVDLTGFNPRKAPEGTALAEQRVQTILRSDPVKGWWMHCLMEGEFTYQSGAVEWGDEVYSSMLQESYECMTKKSRAPSWPAAAKKLRDLIPGGLRKLRKNTNGVRSSIYLLPELDEAREYFSERVGVSL